MTKSQLSIIDSKPEQEQQQPQLQTTPVFLPTQGCNDARQVDYNRSSFWYVLGIFSTICCCFPCGVIGMVHAMIAKHEGERGNLTGYRQRLKQAKCWTIWSIALGTVIIVVFLAAYMVYMYEVHGISIF